MKLARFLVGCALATALQLLGLHLFGSAFAVFDLLLVVALYNAIDNTPVPSLFGGSFAGLIQDALTGGLFGLHGFALTLAAWLVAVLRQRLTIQKPFQVGLLFSLTAVLQLAVIAVLQYAMLPGSEAPDLWTACWRMLSTGALGALMLFTANRIRQRYGAWIKQRRQRLRLEVR